MENRRAEEIFRKYNGLFFHMRRDGDFEEYSSFCISKKQEHEWRLAMQNEFLKKLNTEQNPVLQIKYLRGYADVSRGLKDQYSLRFLLEYTQTHLSTWNTETLGESLGLISGSIERFYKGEAFPYYDELFKDKLLSDVNSMLNDIMASSSSAILRQHIRKISNNLCHL